MEEVTGEAEEVVEVAEEAISFFALSTLVVAVGVEAEAEAEAAAAAVILSEALSLIGQMLL